MQHTLRFWLFVQGKFVCVSDDDYNYTTNNNGKSDSSADNDYHGSRDDHNNATYMFGCLQRLCSAVGLHNRDAALHTVNADFRRGGRCLQRLSSHLFGKLFECRRRPRGATMF
jgi:hypothetical protein